MAINEMEKMARSILGLPPESSFSIFTLEDAFHKAILRDSSEYSIDEIKTAYYLLKPKATAENTVKVLEPDEVIPVVEEKKEAVPTIINNYFNIFPGASDFFQDPNHLKKKNEFKPRPPEPHEFKEIAQMRTNQSLPLLERRKDYLKHHKQLVQEYRARMKEERKATEWYLLPVYYFNRYLENPLYYYLTGWKKALYVGYETVRMIACIPLIVVGIIWSFLGLLYTHFWKWVWLAGGVLCTFIVPIGCAIITYFGGKVYGWEGFYSYFIPNGWALCALCWSIFLASWFGQKIVELLIVGVTYFLMRMFSYGSLYRSWIYDFLDEFF